MEQLEPADVHCKAMTVGFLVQGCAYSSIPCMAQMKIWEKVIANKGKSQEIQNPSQEIQCRRDEGSIQAYFNIRRLTRGQAWRSMVVTRPCRVALICGEQTRHARVTKPASLHRDHYCRDIVQQRLEGK